MQKNLRSAENELLQREAFCRVCDEKFRQGSGDVRIKNAVKLEHVLTSLQVKAHYDTHRKNQVQRCPFCERNWTEWTVQVSRPEDSTP